MSLPALIAQGQRGEGGAATEAMERVGHRQAAPRVPARRRLRRRHGLPAEALFRRGHVNLGTGTDLPIADLAAMVCRVVDFRGAIQFQPEKPDGTPRKLLDLTRLHAMGWRAPTPLLEGLRKTYHWYIYHQGLARNATLVNA